MKNRKDIIKKVDQPDSDILLYTTQDGNQRIEVRLENGTVWLSQSLMAELFQTTTANVNIHIKNIFKEGELLSDSVIKESLITAKNYLTHDESGTLELLVGQYLDFAELQAKRKKIIYMNDWINKLDDFLKVNEHDILANAGKISAELAQERAR